MAIPIASKELATETVSLFLILKSLLMVFLDFDLEICRLYESSLMRTGHPAVSFSKSANLRHREPISD
jgi:hypothetical protein